MSTPYGPPGDHVILEAASRWPHSYYPTFTEAAACFGRLMAAEPLRFGGGRVIPADRYIAERETAYLNQPISEVSQADWDEALGVLPPLDWRRAAGVERFCISEFTFGRVTRQWARLGTRYFTAYVAYGRPDTYLTAARIAQAFGIPEDAPQ